MKSLKKVFSVVLAFAMTLSVFTSADAATQVVTEKSNFVQNTNTKNTFGYIDQVTDQFDVYSTLEKDGISSQIYKPVSGDTMVVTFHGNGEGGVEIDGKQYNNNYSQIAANKLSAAYISDDMQEKLHGAYVLSFQAPNDWYHDHTAVATKVINKAKEEFGIKQIFVSGLSAGGLMAQRMIVANPDMFSGALYSCAAIMKNDTKVEGLGGDYEGATETLRDVGVCECNTPDCHKKPNDFDSYVENYEKWLRVIADTNVPIFMVHAKNDPTISEAWTRGAYEEIQYLREKSENETPVYYKRLNTVNYGNTSYGEHFAWVKMLNNDVLDSTNTIRSLDFIASLSTSTNKYQPKTYTRPSAGTSTAKNTYKYNVIAEVQDGGEKVTSIEINMNGQKVDASKVNKDLFKVTAYGEDASGLVNDQTTPGGDLISGVSKENPLKIAVKDTYVNSKGNIVLVLKDQKAVLNYTQPYSRNLTVNVRYNIEPANLTLFKEVKTPVVKTPAKVTIKSVKAGTKSFTVSWNKASNATKYQVAYKKSTSSKWTYKTLTTKTSMKITKLSSKKKYQVKVRGYNNKKYGSWSTTKTVTVK